MEYKTSAMLRVLSVIRVELCHASFGSLDAIQLKGRAKRDAPYGDRLLQQPRQLLVKILS